MFVVNLGKGIREEIDMSLPPVLRGIMAAAAEAIRPVLCGTHSVCTIVEKERKTEPTCCTVDKVWICSIASMARDTGHGGFPSFMSLSFTLYSSFPSPPPEVYANDIYIKPNLRQMFKSSLVN